MKQLERQISLSSLLTHNALVIMLALVLAAGFIWYQFSSFLDDLELNAAETKIQDKAELLATRLNIYHRYCCQPGQKPGSRKYTQPSG